MRTVLPLFLLLGCVASVNALPAQPPLQGTRAETPTGKRSSCNQEAGQRQGDARRQFMQQCLSARKQARKDRMKTCLQNVGPRTGTERQAWLNDCMTP